MYLVVRDYRGEAADVPEPDEVVEARRQQVLAVEAAEGDPGRARVGLSAVLRRLRDSG